MELHYQQICDALGIAGQVPAIQKAVGYSTHRLATARLALSEKCEDIATRNGFTIVALGSLGRFEASDSSDLDLACLFDEASCPAAEAKVLRERCIVVLRDCGFDIPEKTFDDAIALPKILEHIGGENDTNKNLTYRSLLLTEGEWLLNKAACTEMKDRVMCAYKAGLTTRGKYLTSLLNDLHRYFRTLCIDYRCKIEEGGKEWALRLLKLRDSRKIWHLSNILLYTVASRIPESDRDGFISVNMGRPSLSKIHVALKAGGLDSQVTGPCARLFLAYEFFLARISTATVRDELKSVSYAERHKSTLFEELNNNALGLSEACSDLLDATLTVPEFKKFILRYCLL